MAHRVKEWIWRGFLLAAAVVAFHFIPTGYFLVTPGVVREVKDLVTVEGGRKDARGNLLLVTVGTREANLWLFLYGALDPATGLVHRGELLPPGREFGEYVEENRRFMELSQAVARVVALQRLGYPASLGGEGAEVVEVIPGSPARGKLKEGDVIVAAGGRPVRLAEDLLDALEGYRGGDEVDLILLRGGKRLEVTVPVVEPAGDLFAVKVRTRGWSVKSPLHVGIEAGEISGPSAGLMFALEIIDQLEPEDLTGGRKIAGTGTLDARGRVGGIGGIRQKTLTAMRAGAEAFFVPRGNEEEARKVARGMEVIPVSTLDEALEYLRRLSGARR